MTKITPYNCLSITATIFPRLIPSTLKTVNFLSYQLFRWSSDIPQKKILSYVAEKKSPILPFISKNISTYAPWISNFRKVSANRELLNDPINGPLEHLVKVRIKHPLSQGEQILMGDHSYTVYKKIAAEGLVSYALKPDGENSNLQPLIVFRCTEENFFKEASFESIQNDIDLSLGERGWAATKKRFRELMNDPLFRKGNQKVNVAGYSLGGAHAQHFIAEHHASVSRGIFYNNPSIQAKTVEQFAEDIQKYDRKDPLIFQIFRTQGDPSHLFGEKHLGCDIDHPNITVQLLEIDIPNQHSFNIALHSKRIFDTHLFDYTVSEWTDPVDLSKKLNNNSRSVVSSLFEAIRKQCSSFLSIALNAIRSLFQSLFGQIESKTLP